MTTTKSQDVYRKIKEDLFNQRYAEGDILNEQTIAAEYQVSKTPVREALANLVNEGYLLKYPRRGYFVKEINFREYHELMQSRYILESGVVRCIIENCSDEEIESLYQFTQNKTVSFEEFSKVENPKFHLEMAKLIGNRMVYTTLENLFLRNVRQMSRSGYEILKDDVHCRHRKIIEAIKARDVAAADTLLRQELRREDQVESIF